MFTETALIASIAWALLAPVPDPSPPPPEGVAEPSAKDPEVHGLTAVPGIRVGHHTLEERPTGCTVIVAENGAVAGVDVRGGAPGTREIPLLDPVNLVQRVDAVTLAGGSAFGLDAASGTVRWLEEQGRGFDVGVARVPIVPAAILFDLRVGDASVRPGADCGYRAAAAASSEPVVEGDVGAGAGATVGKLLGGERAMKAGVGSEEIRFEDGLVVAALAVVNAVGTIVDPSTGQAVAGVRSADGSRVLAPAEWLLTGRLDDPLADPPKLLESTTLVVVATNATLDKARATKVAHMAHDGLARSIVPVHTPFDGDTVFVLATGEWPQAVGMAGVLRLGSAAAEVTAAAVLRAARRSQGLPGLPSASSLDASSVGEDTEP